MWCFRKISNISWVDKVTNTEVLRIIGKELEMMNTIKCRKLQYFGHMLRGEKYQCLQLIILGKICWKRSKGRPRTSWLQNLREWFQYNNKKQFSAVKDKELIAMMIYNLR